MRTAVVVLSGGQDSVTCLGLALKTYDLVYCISFEYGQKHGIEIACAVSICNKFGVPLEVVDLSFLSRIVTSALTSDGDVNKPHEYKKGLPASFVPNRNALFLTVAHAHAQEVGADVIYTGVCQTDYSGYPDCRYKFIRRMEAALNIGYETGIDILTPLMYLDKAQTFELADNIGFLDTVINETHTCYEGDHTTFNEWGYGCGECPACKLRANGWDEFKRVSKNG